MPPEGDEELQIEAIIEARNNAERAIQQAVRQVDGYSRRIEALANETGKQVRGSMAQKDALENVSKTVEDTSKAFDAYKDILDGVAGASSRAARDQEGLMDAARKVGTLPGRLEATGDVARGGGGINAESVANVAGTAILLAQAKPVQEFNKSLERTAKVGNRANRTVAVLSGTIGGMVGNVLQGTMAAFRRITNVLGRGLVPVLGLVASGVKSMVTAFLAAAPLLGKIALVILVVWTVLKGLATLFRAFSEDINNFVGETIKPFTDAWTEFKEEAIEALLPLIVILGGAFALLAKVLQVVMTKAIAPAFKFFLDIVLVGIKTVVDAIVSFIDLLLPVVQVVVDNIFAMINAVKLAFSIMTNENMSFLDKMKMFGRLFIGVFANAISTIINLFGELTRFILKWPVGLAFDLTRNVAQHLLAPLVRLFALMGEKILAGFEFIANGFIGMINTMIDGVNQVARALGKEGDLIGKLGTLDLSGTVPTTEEIADALVQGINMAKDTVLGLIDSLVDNTVGKVVDLIDALTERFGGNLQGIADELGVELLEAPQLQKLFRDFLETGVKQLSEKLDALGDTVDQVNMKDARIEINPFIQVLVTKDVDEEELRKKLGKALDKAFEDAVKGLPSDVFRVAV